ncbi:MAG: 2-oxo-4-hydroxy-4-carboxy-5-ureidoimidazoline decarboxylase [Candidatus Marinimicrobia bacterium]|jgi:2-oxo-4-hydroxy-4-carboxy-5-ureidoimidazoline decarboxylase|nr:2-oxo-4-hydroxy-4-carboxy-5-ureidoimidazoline decarboxylase [Candidatus Neomarinimicrobiota bacterium]MBT3946257.1 2-oxo-4-hydroxy-4-carboxy-5-ureidoimidazoline decarboxylase [Candidatus Neomarinimicrobiota bacterium]MBT4554392.1 2-oxo-4-hydroxy-4-carboxy-5-ureidoimidazoline decarboxylase [Candidatus Neomarinimicrobiota bacterium]MBT5114631.1 2-oxo-4-hydroxy-4-carboxy-5-ureidoimidazoline decarboxylase [Candidatus Neomarinimicrobiota bacterium]MBT5748648.1 2-oxo-4-hydroxy-4-carboxy-5-ureidoim|tara:strand:+ start:975 stop:1478 length:504 start_codon:yes stop_codon:yes gene_type:complete
MTIESFNSLTDSEAFKEFEMCCGATNWVKRIIASRPIDSKGALLKVAEEIWFSLKSEDWLEAFTHHPKIGDIESLREKFHNTKSISENEQSGVNDASENTLKNLAKSNQLYEDKFGFIFIVCATGKSADQMLTLIKMRLNNNIETEMQNAAKEQNKITQLRLEKLLK